MLYCKICDKSFEKERGLHIHISRIHDISVGEYYERHEPRFNLLTGQPIKYENREQYFSSSFDNPKQMRKWLSSANEEDAKEFLIESLKNRIESKELKYAPNHLGLRTSGLPTLDFYEKFGGYKSYCDFLEIEPLNFGSINKDKFEKIPDDLRIFVDTREQQPLTFPDSLDMKLDFGDYTLKPPHHNKVFIERKSGGDFKGTVTAGYDRFYEELSRVQEFGCYMYVVVEANFKQLFSENNMPNTHTFNMPFVFHNMRVLAQKFRGTCQFVFVNGRDSASWLVPRLLYHGQDVKNADVQYFLHTQYGLD